MASKLITGMGLHPSILNILAARNIVTAKDVLYKTELELMELLDVPLAVVATTVLQISKQACPPFHTVLSLMEERQKELLSGHLPTQLRTLDDALCGGLPFGVVTEVVGPAGIGKTQLCLMLSVSAALPKKHGGLDGGVLYFDTEHKFNSRRMLEIAQSRFPDVYNNEEMIHQLATRVLVLHPMSLGDFTESLQGLEEAIIEHQVKLLIVDSVAAFMPREDKWDELPWKHDLLGCQAAILKSLAESFRIPVLVTNQVRVRYKNKGLDATFSFEGSHATQIGELASASGEEGLEMQLAAALGTNWAHAVNIRLILESLSGQRFIKIAKCPMSATLAFPYSVTSAGLNLIGTEAFEISNNDVMAASNVDYEAAFLGNFEGVIQ